MWLHICREENNSYLDYENFLSLNRIKPINAVILTKVKQEYSALVQNPIGKLKYQYQITLDIFFYWGILKL